MAHFYTWSATMYVRSARPGPDFRQSGPFASLVPRTRGCTTPAGLKLNTATLDRLPNTQVI